MAITFQGQIHNHKADDRVSHVLATPLTAVLMARTGKQVDYLEQNGGQHVNKGFRVSPEWINEGRGKSQIGKGLREYVLRNVYW